MRRSFLAWFDRQQVVRIVLYYAALAVVLLVLYRVAPSLPGVFSTENFEASISEITKTNVLATEARAALRLSPVEVVGTSLLMMLGAVLLMLPVAWVHILTRSRKGFSQSMVQTLIMLPLVVAGVLTIVQHSLPLAFALGGVVGAVSFRNRLADPKDAIYIFVAIATGLAAGVQVLAVAAAISIFFNLVVLTAWWFDFGRMPAMLEATVAQRRLERVKASRGGGSSSDTAASLSGTGGAMRADFMNLVDKQLLQSMTPDQLQALSERAAERRRKAVAREDADETWAEKKPRFDAVIRVAMPGHEATTVRRAIEAVMSGQTKRWVLEKTVPEAGQLAMGDTLTASYLVRFGKSMPGPLVVEAMRRAALPQAITIEVLDA